MNDRNLLLTRNITDSVTLTAKTSDENFVIFFNVIEATVPGYEGRDLLSVFDKLHTHTLADGRVGLFGFDTAENKK